MTRSSYITLSYYFLLIVILGTAWAFFNKFSGFPNIQYQIAILSCAGYFIWGIVFHAAKGDLHRKIVIEYALIALVAAIVARGAIFR